MALIRTEMPDDQFALFQRYLSIQQILNPKVEVVLLIKLFWDVLDDVPRMQDFVDRFDLAHLKNLRDGQDANRSTLDMRIMDLETATGETGATGATGETR